MADSTKADTKKKGEEKAKEEEKQERIDADDITIVIESTQPKTAVKRQIASKLATLIYEGELEPGAILPTARQLASANDLSASSVGEAYDLLREQGLLTTKGSGRGMIIAELSEQELRDHRLKPVKDALGEVFVQAKALGVEEEELKDLFKDVVLDGL